MSLTIPEAYRRGFVRFLTYPEGKIEDLLAFLDATAVAPSLDHLSRAAADETGLPNDELADVLYAIASLNALRERSGMTPDEIVNQLEAAVQEDLKDDLEDPLANWGTIKQVISSMLKEGSILATTWKARSLRDEHERRYCHAKLVSDLRPVFRLDDELPEAGIIHHQLMLTYHAADFRTEQFFVSLRRPHLVRLRQEIDRALWKDEKLRKLTQRAGLVVLADEDEEV